MDGFRIPGLALLMAAALAAPAAADDFEAEVLSAINFARANPQAFAESLRRDLGDDATWAGDEPGAVDEAVAFLMRQTPLPPLRPEARLDAAARHYAGDQGASGEVGHVGPTGQTFGQRLAQAGVFAGVMAENISYGQMSAQDVVRQLIVDSGVRDRGHRQDIFGRAYQAAGVGCGDHSRFGAMCVIEFAGAIVQR